MVGNHKLAEMGFGEEALGHNAILAGFQARGNGRIIFQTATLWRQF